MFRLSLFCFFSLFLAFSVSKLNALYTPEVPNNDHSLPSNAETASNAPKIQVNSPATTIAGFYSPAALLGHHWFSKVPKFKDFHSFLKYFKGDKKAFNPKAWESERINIITNLVGIVNNLKLDVISKTKVDELQEILQTKLEKKITPELLTTDDSPTSNSDSMDPTDMIFDYNFVFVFFFFKNQAILEQLQWSINNLMKALQMTELPADYMDMLISLIQGTMEPGSGRSIIQNTLIMTADMGHFFRVKYRRIINFKHVSRLALIQTTREQIFVPRFASESMASQVQKILVFLDRLLHNHIAKLVFEGIKEIETEYKFSSSLQNNKE